MTLVFEKNANWQKPQKIVIITWNKFCPLFFARKPFRPKRREIPKMLTPDLELLVVCRMQPDEGLHHDVAVALDLADTI
jgi:hypothetical protein